MTTINIEALDSSALDVAPQARDWSEGWSVTWEYFEAPICSECGEYARLDAGTHEWRCPNHPDIEQGPTDGPMMNYAYPLPSLGVADGPAEAADLLYDLPLCVVVREDNDELAFTGGGMDLSWEICEAFMRLGFLPPFHFAELSVMAGRGQSDRDRAIIAACRRSVTEYAARIENRVRFALQTLDRIEQGH